MHNSTISGGKTIYGASVGILSLDTKFPRIPGDVGNAGTWPFPVLYKVVRGATTHKIVHEKGNGLAESIIAAARELVDEGADGIATTGGFMGLFQSRIAESCGVPVATSSVMQVPWVQSLMPPGKRVGVLTVNAQAFDADHLAACGAPVDTPIAGTEAGMEMTRVFVSGGLELNVRKAEDDVVQAARNLLAAHPEVGAIVMECHNMAPYSNAVHRVTGLPVFDIYTFIRWFQAGLSPRAFAC